MWHVYMLVKYNSELYGRNYNKAVNGEVQYIVFSHGFLLDLLEAT